MNDNIHIGNMNMNAMVSSFTLMDHTVNIGNNLRMKNYIYIFLMAKIKNKILKCIISKTNSFSFLKVLLNKVNTILINHKYNVKNTKSQELYISIKTPVNIGMSSINS